MISTRLCIAFEGSRRIAAGELGEVVVKAKEIVDRDGWEAVLILDDATSQTIDVDFRGSVEDVLGRLAAPDSGAPRGPGRPKLGVVPREVTLLPRHWEWLNSQPGGASVALRKLVEEARRANEGKDRKREAQESAYRFLSTMAGNEPGFEEAARALFSDNRERFELMAHGWPPDVQAQAITLALRSFSEVVS